jgi:hypothetical protein
MLGRSIYQTLSLVEVGICVYVYASIAASLLARNWHENGKEMRSTSASIYALQTAIN